MNTVKVGIVGLGELDAVHATNLIFSIPNAELMVAHLADDCPSIV